MKFHKALKRARKIARDSEYCVFIYRDNKHNMLGFEVSGVTLTPISIANLALRKPIRKRSFSIKDFLADDWVVMDAYGEE